jgi:hypothetical protein
MAEQGSKAALRMKFVDANDKAAVEGEDRQPAIVNYFVGPPDTWHTKIATYARVRYRALYPGVDVVFHGNNQELEYDLVLAPEADPSRIKFTVQGAREIRLDKDSNLLLLTPQGELVQPRPRIYQRKNGTLREISGSYVVSNNEVGFSLGAMITNLHW